MKKKQQKMKNLRKGFSNVHYFPLSLINLNFDIFSKNLLHNMAYHVWTFLGLFKPDDQGIGHIYGIDCDNLLIFRRWVHLGMKKNVAN